MNGSPAQRDISDQELFDALEGLRQDVDRWRGQTQGAPQPPEAGSALARDDAALDPYRTSHAVWTGLMAATDHMHALIALVIDARTLGLYAPNAIVRSVLDNAATIVWLLEPLDPKERYTRRLTLAYDEHVNANSAAATAGTPLAVTNDQKKDEFLAMTRRLELSGDQRSRACNSFKYYAVMKEAGEVLRTDLSLQIPQPWNNALLAWQFGSAFSHGRAWPHLMLGLEAPMPGPDQGTVNLPVTPSRALLRFAATITHRMLALAWGLYDQRRR